jgi:pimeloyl-ACP methyl ester carboxylesterase
MGRINIDLELVSIERRGMNGSEEIYLHTNLGTIKCHYHETISGDAAVVWVGDVGGGIEGPAGGLYSRLAMTLTKDQIASIRLDYREPGDLMACVLDTLLTIKFLAMLDRTRIVLVGHSFGGAVVINAGVSVTVVGVAALSSQTAGTDLVDHLSPRPLLLIHGTDDEILPDACSHDIYLRAKDPKEILLYKGCRHGLDECRTAVDDDLLEWIRKILS